MTRQQHQPNTRVPLVDDTADGVVRSAGSVCTQASGEKNFQWAAKIFYVGSRPRALCRLSPDLRLVAAELQEPMLGEWKNVPQTGHDLAQSGLLKLII